MNSRRLFLFDLRRFRLHSSQVSRVPGSMLLCLAETVFSQKIYREVFEPILSDLWIEYSHALAENRGRLKLFFIRFRGYWSFWAAFSMRLPFPFLKALAKLIS